MDKISVIVPIYKVENYLEKCLNSITNQTYKNLEIILIDDGSPDNCGEICERYALEDERIKVIHKENGGLSAARNTGIDVSTGKYVVFVDSDDWIAEDYCEVLFDALVNNDADVAAVDYYMIDENEKILNIDSQTDDGFSETVIYEKSEIIKEMLAYKTFKNFAWNKIYKTEMLRNNKFPEGVNYEDTIFTCDLLHKCSKIVFITKKCYYYLQRGNSITRMHTEKNMCDFARSAEYRFNKVCIMYPELETNNIYSLLTSTLALGSMQASSEKRYRSVEEHIEGFIEIIKNYLMKNEDEILRLANDYQKLSIYLIKYNTELWYNFLEKRKELKEKGILK